MPPTIHCIRHAQGFHNLTTANHTMPDPSLTDHGQQQCKTLSESFPHMSSIDLIVASPIRRTLYTALLTFSPILATKNIPIVALPELQETSDLPCDTGSDPAALAKEFGKYSNLDLSRVHDGWNVKDNRDGVMAAPNAPSIIARARTAKRFLRARPEKNIAVVTHGGYLHYFTDAWDGIANFTAGTAWANTEWRSYEFAEDGSDEVGIVETKESRERRRGGEKPLGEAEQRNLKKSVVATWTGLGYIKAPPEVVGEEARRIWREIMEEKVESVL